ncbi:MAG: prolipoprotein diacylglyceryl transferase [Deltaproteobacteria bacterium]|nr:MAG: prolipoprotein diacylglyceryl transferase [Deltaproteobacteria bacterium]
MGGEEARIHPVLIDLPGLPLHSYGILAAVGFVLVVFLILRRTAALGIPRDHVVDIIFYGAIMGIVGSRALFVWQNLELFDSIGQMVNIRTGGLVFYGAMLAGLPTGAFVMWYRGVPFFALMDVLATAMPLGHAIARIGCIMAGCCFGLPTDLPWAVTYSHPLAVAPPHGVPLHPVQLYESLLLFGIAAVTNLTYAKRKWVGQGMFTYLLLYAMVRSFTEQFRGDASRGFLFEDVLGQTLSFSTGISMAIALIAVVLFFFVARQVNPEPPETGSAPRPA